MSSKIGKLVISFDFELAWGSIESNWWVDREKAGLYQKLRNDLPELLQGLQAREIMTTWGIVGAMLQQPKQYDFSHLPITYQKYLSTVIKSAEPSSLQAFDLLDYLMNSTKFINWACHSYSHTRFNYKGMDTVCAAAELQNFNDVVKAYGIACDYMIFPQNIEAHYGVLLEYGYQRFRGYEYKNSNKLQRIISKYITVPPMSVKQQTNIGLQRETGSLFFNPGRNRSYLLPLIMRQTKRGIRQAVKSGGTFHLWNHPFNFSEHFGLMEAFFECLDEAVEMRDKALLTIEAV